MKKIRVLAGLVASVALLAGMVSVMPSAAQAASTYKIITSPKGEAVPSIPRIGPGSNYAMLGTPAKASQSFDCWVKGTPVHGDYIWGRIAGTGNGFIADWWIQLNGKTLNTKLPQCPGATSNKTPVGFLDSVSVFAGNSTNRGGNTVVFTGWATDPDKLSSNVTIVVYAQQGSYLYKLGSGTTGGTRADVKKVHPTYSNKTGYAVYVQVASGVPTTYKVYAVDVNTGAQTLLTYGTKTLTAK
ncbi:MAG: hypothetical protein FWF25_06470 [Propionibacteriaceae bacterium]|nr:hypothetical protein [Propionibacteriaceae bacterium]